MSMDIIIGLVKDHQLNIMLVLSGVCATLVYLTGITKTLSTRRRHILSLMELSAMLLMVCDRSAYLYRGDMSLIGYWMVRGCNFMVYLCTIAIPFAVSLYLYDLYENEGQMTTPPKRLRVCACLAVAGIVLLVISQFTGLYYTFDNQNRYQRAPGNVICYVVPLSMALLILSAVLQYRNVVSRRMTVLLTLNLVVPIVASIIQLFTYGISLTNLTSAGMVVLLFNRAYIDLNASVERARTNEIEAYKEAQRREHALFEQTAEALVSAIDAKDEYTRGHSARVAMYSELIATELGMSDVECQEVYFAALLHDVGKIGVADSIIKKEGRLTNEEFAQIKLHPVFGHQILSSIRELPYLSVGAHYHHERYDGRGYPEGLRGEEIPQIARIIGVADAYDAMTSKRSYRDLRPQHLVREELVKGMGTQFDPHYAAIMLHYMDLDLSYAMHEQLEGQSADLVEGLNSQIETQVRCDEVYHDCSTGIRIIDTIARVSFDWTGDEGYGAQEALPTMVLFDALDGMVHESGALEKDYRYFEYARTRFDGHTIRTKARVAQTTFDPREGTARSVAQGPNVAHYEIEAVRHYDHVQVCVSDGSRAMRTIVALPFSGRYSYLSLTGEHGTISNLRVERGQQHIDASYIPRIAEEVSYIRGCPTGDIPNLQVEGPRTHTSEGIVVGNGMRLTFHAQAFPNARLVWHCPYLCFYTLADGTVGGDGFRELVLIRFDGEELVSNVLAVHEGASEKTETFEGWDAWKQGLKDGLDCEVDIRRRGSMLCIVSNNLGIAIHSEQEVPQDAGQVYVALTGDQCAITNIRIHRDEHMEV